MPLGLVIAAPSAFAASPCGELPPTDLQLQPLSVEDIQEEIAPAEKIAQLSTVIRGDAPHPLMAVRYVMDSNVAPVHRLVPAPGGYCDAPKRVVFGFGVTRRRVILTPEAASESCVKSALLAHEADHYRFVREAIREFLQGQEEAVARKLEQLKAQRATDEDSARRAMEAGLLGVSAQLIQQFNQNVGRIREMIDSPAQLAALSASCNGRVAELEGRARRREREL
ncbi:MAG: hypothetical protein AB7O13_03155 [Alphaproteobacteria bacterium]